MSYTVAGLSSWTLKSFREGLVNLDAQRVTLEGEVEKYQDEIDALTEQQEESKATLADVRAQQEQVAGLLVDRFRSAPRYRADQEGDSFWEVYDLYMEEVVETFSSEQDARRRCAQLEERRASNLHRFETIDYWVKVSP